MAVCQPVPRIAPACVATTETLTQKDITMHWIDWTIVAGFLVSMVALGMYFSKRASDSIDSYFVSGRTLTWYIAGASMVATSFAADTPLWVSALVREHGIHAVWQYWSPLIGSALAVVLFSRLWRRLSVLTDVEMLELRYSGPEAKTLRGLTATMGALVICPLIIGWVVKAMDTIAREALGLPPEYQFACTSVILICSMLLCAFSGLYGVVYTDFVQFIIATAGVIILAVLSIYEVGGIASMVEQLSTNEQWMGSELNITPRIGSTPGYMSIWNAIGFFGLLWIGVAMSGGYQAQRILACKDSRHASLAVLMHTIIYYAVISWPWIIVGMASIIIFPDMGEAGHDAAYPRMVIHILPIGLRGLMISAMIAAFISTISTLFNWGSSYIVNDLYRRFIRPEEKPTHYVVVARLMTVFVGVTGAIISLWAENIQQLLGIFYVVGGGALFPGLLRWFWWRMTARAELAAFVISWVVALLMLFGKVFDAPMAVLLNLPNDISFSSDYNLTGARMFFMALVSIAVSVVVSLFGKPTDMQVLKEFVRRSGVSTPGWGPVVREMDGYQPGQTWTTTLWHWGLVTALVVCLLCSIGSFVCGRWMVSAVLFAMFFALLVHSVIGISRELSTEES